MTDKANLQLALEQARSRRDEQLAALQDYLRIPSISTQPQHRDDIYRAAAWLAQFMTDSGLHNARVVETGGHPAVYGEWLENPGAPTVLVYGHYDVQPIDPIELWHHDPFGAEVVGDRIYARGASDNKAQHFSHVEAVRAILDATGSLPLNLKFLIDGEEEIGSPVLPSFVAEHTEMLAADSVIVSDGGMIRPGQPTLNHALRGVADFEVHVSGPARDLHSGSHGGAVHNPAQALAEMISKLHDDQGRVAVPGFYDQVVELTGEERALLAERDYDEAQWREDTGAPAPWGEVGYSILERRTVRPTLEVNGIWGGYTGPGMKTVLPAEAHAKLTTRLVARQDPARIQKLVAEHIMALAPPTVRVTVDTGAASAAAVTAYDGPEVQAAMAAQRAVWGVEPVLNRNGGSLPILATFQEVLGAPFLALPLGLDDNRHAPDEHYGLEYLYKGIETAIRYYYNYAEETKKH